MTEDTGETHEGDNKGGKHKSIRKTTQTHRETKKSEHKTQGKILNKQQNTEIHRV